MYQFRDSDNDSDSSNDDLREKVAKTAFEHSLVLDDSPLFGLSRTTIDLSALHPDPVQIFKIWQIYLDKVNPLLKVTHTPSLQARIIEATSNIRDIDPNLEALMFGIYSMSVLSVTVEDCSATFGSSREDLLMRYQFGCQQALLNCKLLQSSDRDCLTALFLYLVRLVRTSILSSSLTMPGLCQTNHNSSVLVLHTWNCNAHCIADGYSKRISLGKLYRCGSGNA